MMSEHWVRYHRVSWPLPLGAVKVCVRVESRVGVTAPMKPAERPLCTGSPTVLAEPVVVQPDRPFSKVPLAITPLFGDTARVNGVACVADGDVPVMVSPKLPVGVAAEVEIVTVDESPARTDGGLNAAVTPAGSPDADTVTVSGEPSTTEVPTVAVADPPADADTAGGLTDMVKSLPPLLTQPGSWNDATRVCQLKFPVLARYWLAYQNVQPSAGSTTSEL